MFAGAPRISEIPTEFLDYMGLVFGASIKDYAQDIAGKIDIWTLDNQPRKILITESTKVSSQMVTVPSGYNPMMLYQPNATEKDRQGRTIQVSEG